MGLWASIKKTLNSTLGTSDFQPLDKIITGQRTLAASDSVLNVVFSGSTNVSTSREIIGEFTPKVNGSIRILVTYENSSVSSRTFYIEVVKSDNGIIVAEKSLTASGEQLNHLFIDVPIEANVQYEINVNASAGVKVKSVNIGAQIVDTSLVEVI